MTLSLNTSTQVAAGRREKEANKVVKNTQIRLQPSNTFPIKLFIAPVGVLLLTCLVS